MSSGQGLVWSSTFDTGQPVIDEQHHKLFLLIDELTTCIEDGSDKEKLKDTLDFLIDYTVKHFNDEEEIQLKYEYPMYKRHKVLHEDFKDSVSELVNNYESNENTDELGAGVNEILTKWMVYHILNEDRKLGDHIKSMEK